MVNFQIKVLIDQFPYVMFLTEAITLATALILTGGLFPSGYDYNVVKCSVQDPVY